jgi:hypothetical protein
LGEEKVLQHQRAFDLKYLTQKTTIHSIKKLINFKQDVVIQKMGTSKENLLFELQFSNIQLRKNAASYK